MPRDSEQNEWRTVSRRRVLGLLSGATIGAIAGCGGDDGSTESPTDTETPTEAETTAQTTETTTTAPTTTTTTETTAVTTTEPTPTDTETPTATAVPGLPPDPEPLVSFPEDQFQPVLPGETLTITTDIVNPYTFPLQNGEVTLETSASGFSITAVSGTSFDTLPELESQEAEWEITVPGENGEYEMTANVTYSAGEDSADIDVTIPVNVLSIEAREDEIFIPQTGGGVTDEPAFTLLPEGDDISDPTTVDNADDLSADFYFGYDADNLYLKAEVTDDTHAAKSGTNMWQNDNVQYAAGIDGTYGPEDGFAHVDGSAATWRWYDGEASQGVDSVSATTSRDDGNSLTTYDVTIPWTALFAESKGAGDSFHFSVQVNEADSEGDTRKAVLGWTLPGINVDKTYGALGVFHLEDPDN